MSVWVEGVSAIVLPTEDPHLLEGCLACLRDAEVLEVLVQDPGGKGATTAVARDRGAVILRGGGEGLASAAHAVKHTRGTVCWFLHPRCRVPKESAFWILDAVERGGAVGGHFCICGAGWRGWMSNAFAAWGWLAPYAGLFCDRDVFDSIHPGLRTDIPLERSLFRGMLEAGAVIKLPIRIDYAKP